MKEYLLTENELRCLIKIVSTAVVIKRDRSDEHFFDNFEYWSTSFGDKILNDFINQTLPYLRREEK